MQRQRDLGFGAQGFDGGGFGGGLAGIVIRANGFGGGNIGGGNAGGGFGGAMRNDEQERRQNETDQCSVGSQAITLRQIEYYIHKFYL